MNVAWVRKRWVTPLGYLASGHGIFHRTSKKCMCVQFIILWGQNLFASSHVETRLPYGDKNPVPTRVTIYFRVKSWF